MRVNVRGAGVLLASALWLGCDDATTTTTTDGGSLLALDGGGDAAGADARVAVDAAVAVDAPPAVDAPVEVDASVEADAPIAPDAPVAPVAADAPPAPDGAPPPPPPPPPIGRVDYGAASGLVGPILDVSTDEGGNLWAISPDTLYLLTPGAARFQAFTNADGLHVEPFTAVDGSPSVTTLTAVAGAAANELYLGYHGYEGSADPFLDTPAQKELGNGDRITYDPASGRINVLRYQFRCIVEVNRCWENRSVRRIVVGHSGAAAGHAFFGFNHGTTHVYADVLGDHVHPQIDWVMDDQRLTRYGENQALALQEDGTLWIGNRYGVGLMNWDPDPIAWVSARFAIAFTTHTDDHELSVPWGYTENNRGAAVTGDGTLWLASDNLGLSSWVPGTSFTTLRHWNDTPGLPTNLTDVVADVDGTLWIVTAGHALLHFDPLANAVTPTDISDARRLYLDREVTPRALVVARSGGVTVLR